MKVSKGFLNMYADIWFKIKVEDIASEPEIFEESLRAKTFSDFVELMSGKGVELIKKDYPFSDSIEIVSVEFLTKTKKEDDSKLTVVASKELGIVGSVSTEISEEDMDSQLRKELRKIKKIVDDALSK